MPGSGKAPAPAPHTRLETARLAIRTFEPRDAQGWVALVNDPQVNRFLPPGPDLTLEDFANVLAARHAMEREHHFVMWAVEERRPARSWGSAGYARWTRAPGPEIDLAYHYTSANWGTGYATEAVTAVLTHGLRTLGLDRIMAVAMPQNIAS